MKTWFNYKSKQSLPSINIDSEHSIAIEEGYAANIANHDSSSTWLAFKDVEEHIDGNGLSTLWIAQGSGIFYYDGMEIILNEHDVILFDDNVEHGFFSENICIGLNITWGIKTPTIMQVQEKIESALNPVYKMKIK